MALREKNEKSDPARLRLKSVALKGERRITAGLYGHRSPAWSGDGELLAFAVGDQQHSAWLLSDRRGRVAALLEGPALGRASFGPSGAIAYGRQVGHTGATRGEIWLSPRLGVLPFRLCGGDGLSYRDPSFAPDGLSLVVAAAESETAPSHLLWIDLQSGKRQTLTADRLRSDQQPTFSPDGKTLFFCGETRDPASSECAILGLDLERGELHSVSGHETRDRHPAALSSDWVVVERSGTGAVDRAELVLIDCSARATGGARREKVLSSGELDQREPAVLVLHDKVRIAYASLLRSVDEFPARFDICVARMKGLPLESKLEKADAAATSTTVPSATESAPPPAHEPTQAQARAQA